MVNQNDERNRDAQRERLCDFLDRNCNPSKIHATLGDHTESKELQNETHQAILPNEIANPNVEVRSLAKPERSVSKARTTQPVRTATNSTTADSTLITGNSLDNRSHGPIGASWKPKHVQAFQWMETIEKVALRFTLMVLLLCGLIHVLKAEWIALQPKAVPAEQGWPSKGADTHSSVRSDKTGIESASEGESY